LSPYISDNFAHSKSAQHEWDGYQIAQVLHHLVLLAAQVQNVPGHYVPHQEEEQDPPNVRQHVVLDIGDPSTHINNNKLRGVRIYVLLHVEVGWQRSVPNALVNTRADGVEQQLDQGLSQQEAG
jgi:hypothetical protein